MNCYRNSENFDWRFRQVAEIPQKYIRAPCRRVSILNSSLISKEFIKKSIRSSFGVDSSRSYCHRSAVPQKIVKVPRERTDFGQRHCATWGPPGPRQSGQTGLAIALAWAKDISTSAADSNILALGGRAVIWRLPTYLPTLFSLCRSSVSFVSHFFTQNSPRSLTRNRMILFFEIVSMSRSN